MGEWDHQSQNPRPDLEPSKSDHAPENVFVLQLTSPTALIECEDGKMRPLTNQPECPREMKQKKQEVILNKFSSNTSFGSSPSSSTSSYLEISRTYPTKTSRVRTFFTAPSEHKRKVKKTKRRVSFFRTGYNSSSSSINSDLAYGTGFIRRSKRKLKRRISKDIDPNKFETSEQQNQITQDNNYKEKERSIPGFGSSESPEFSVAEKSRYNRRSQGKKRTKNPSKKGSKDIDTTAEILAIGAELKKLARDSNSVDFKSARNRNNSRRGPRSRKSDVCESINLANNPSVNEDWESICESGSDSSVDSKLAYGSNHKSCWDIFGWSKSTKSPSPTNSYVESMAYGFAHENVIGSIQSLDIASDTILDELNDYHPTPGMSDSTRNTRNPTRKIKVEKDLVNDHLWPLIPTTATAPALDEQKRFSTIESDPLIPTSFHATPLQIVQPKPITPISQSIYEPELHLNIKGNSDISTQAGFHIEPLPENEYNEFSSSRFEPGVISQQDRSEWLAGRYSELLDDGRPQIREFSPSGLDTYPEQNLMPWLLREPYNSQLDMEHEDKKYHSDLSEARLEIDYPKMERNSGKKRMKELELHGSGQDWYACSEKDKKHDSGNINYFDNTNSARKLSRFHDDDRNDEIRGVEIPFSAKITDDISPVTTEDSHSDQTNDKSLKTHHWKREPHFLNPSRSYSPNQQTWKKSSCFYNQADALSHDKLEDFERGRKHNNNPCDPLSIATVGVVAAITTGRGYRKSRSRKRKNVGRPTGYQYENSQEKDNPSTLATSLKVETDIELEKRQSYLKDSKNHKQCSSPIRPIPRNPCYKVADFGQGVGDLSPDRDSKQELGFYNPLNVKYGFDYLSNNRDKPQSPWDSPASLNYSKPEPCSDPDSGNDSQISFNNLIKSTQTSSSSVNVKEAISSPWLTRMSRKSGINLLIRDDLNNSEFPPTKSTNEPNVSKFNSWRNDKTKLHQRDSPSSDPDMYVPNLNLFLSRILMSSCDASYGGAEELNTNVLTETTRGGDFMCNIPSGSDNKPQSIDYTFKNTPNKDNLLSLSSVNPDCFDTFESTPHYYSKEQPECTAYLKETPQISKDFGEDLDFIAYIAAGLQETGFDPGIVIDDPRFRQKSFTPDKLTSNVYKYANFAETVTDLDTNPTDTTKTREANDRLNYDRHVSFKHDSKSQVDLIPEKPDNSNQSPINITENPTFRNKSPSRSFKLKGKGVEKINIETHASKEYGQANKSITLYNGILDHNASYSPQLSNGEREVRKTNTALTQPNLFNPKEDLVYRSLDDSSDRLITPKTHFRSTEPKLSTKTNPETNVCEQATENSNHQILTTLDTEHPQVIKGTGMPVQVQQHLQLFGDKKQEINFESHPATVAHMRNQVSGKISMIEDIESSQIGLRLKELSFNEPISRNQSPLKTSYKQAPFESHTLSQSLKRFSTPFVSIAQEKESEKIKLNHTQHELETPGLSKELANPLRLTTPTNLIYEGFPTKRLYESTSKLKCFDISENPQILEKFDMSRNSSVSTPSRTPIIKTENVSKENKDLSLKETEVRYLPTFETTDEATDGTNVTSQGQETTEQRISPSKPGLTSICGGYDGDNSHPDPVMISKTVFRMMEFDKLKEDAPNDTKELGSDESEIQLKNYELVHESKIKSIEKLESHEINKQLVKIQKSDPIAIPNESMKRKRNKRKSGKNISSLNKKEEIPDAMIFSAEKPREIHQTPIIEKDDVNENFQTGILDDSESPHLLVEAVEPVVKNGMAYQKSQNDRVTQSPLNEITEIWPKSHDKQVDGEQVVNQADSGEFYEAESHKVSEESTDLEIYDPVDTPRMKGTGKNSQGKRSKQQASESDNEGDSKSLVVEPEQDGAVHGGYVTEKDESDCEKMTWKHECEPREEMEKTVEAVEAVSPHSPTTNHNREVEENVHFEVTPEKPLIFVEKSWPYVDQSDNDGIEYVTISELGAEEHDELESSEAWEEPSNFEVHKSAIMQGMKSQIDKVKRKRGKQLGRKGRFKMPPSKRSKQLRSTSNNEGDHESLVAESEQDVAVPGGYVTEKDESDCEKMTGKHECEPREESEKTVEVVEAVTLDSSTTTYNRDVEENVYFDVTLEKPLIFAEKSRPYVDHFDNEVNENDLIYEVGTGGFFEPESTEVWEEPADLEIYESAVMPGMKNMNENSERKCGEQQVSIIVDEGSSLSPIVKPERKVTVPGGYMTEKNESDYEEMKRKHESAPCEKLEKTEEARTPDSSTPSHNRKVAKKVHFDITPVKPLIFAKKSWPYIDHYDNEVNENELIYEIGTGAFDEPEPSKVWEEPAEFEITESAVIPGMKSKNYDADKKRGKQHTSKSDDEISSENLIVQPEQKLAIPGDHMTENNESDNEEMTWKHKSASCEKLEKTEEARTPDSSNTSHDRKVAKKVHFDITSEKPLIFVEKPWSYIDHYDNEVNENELIYEVGTGAFDKKESPELWEEPAGFEIYDTVEIPGLKRKNERLKRKRRNQLTSTSGERSITGSLNVEPHQELVSSCSFVPKKDESDCEESSWNYDTEPPEKPQRNLETNTPSSLTTTESQKFLKKVHFHKSSEKPMMFSENLGTNIDHHDNEIKENELIEVGSGVLDESETTQLWEDSVDGEVYESAVMQGLKRKRKNPRRKRYKEQELLIDDEGGTKSIIVQPEQQENSTKQVLVSGGSVLEKSESIYDASISKNVSQALEMFEKPTGCEPCISLTFTSAEKKNKKLVPEKRKGFDKNMIENLLSIVQVDDQLDKIKKGIFKDQVTPGKESLTLRKFSKLRMQDESCESESIFDTNIMPVEIGNKMWSDNIINELTISSVTAKPRTHESKTLVENNEFGQEHCKTINQLISSEMDEKLVNCDISEIVQGSDMKRNKNTKDSNSLIIKVGEVEDLTHPRVKVVDPFCSIRERCISTHKLSSNDQSNLSTSLEVPIELEISRKSMIADNNSMMIKKKDNSGFFSSLLEIEGEGSEAIDVSTEHAVVNSEIPVTDKDQTCTIIHPAQFSFGSSIATQLTRPQSRNESTVLVQDILLNSEPTSELNYCNENFKEYSKKGEIQTLNHENMSLLELDRDKSYKNDLKVIGLPSRTPKHSLLRSYSHSSKYPGQTGTSKIDHDIAELIDKYHFSVDIGLQTKAAVGCDKYEFINEEKAFKTEVNNFIVISQDDIAKGINFINHCNPKLLQQDPETEYSHSPSTEILRKPGCKPIQDSEQRSNLYSILTELANSGKTKENMKSHNLLQPEQQSEKGTNILRKKKHTKLLEEAYNELDISRVSIVASDPVRKNESSTSIGTERQGHPCSFVTEDDKDLCSKRSSDVAKKLEGLKDISISGDISAGNIATCNIYGDSEDITLNIGDKKLSWLNIKTDESSVWSIIYGSQDVSRNIEVSSSQGKVILGVTSRIFKNSMPLQDFIHDLDMIKQNETQILDQSRKAIKSAHQGFVRYRRRLSWDVKNENEIEVQDEAIPTHEKLQHEARTHIFLHQEPGNPTLLPDFKDITINERYLKQVKTEPLLKEENSHKTTTGIAHSTSHSEENTEAKLKMGNDRFIETTVDENELIARFSNCTSAVNLFELVTISSTDEKLGQKNIANGEKQEAKETCQLFQNNFELPSSLVATQENSMTSRNSICVNFSPIEYHSIEMTPKYPKALVGYDMQESLHIEEVVTSPDSAKLELGSQKFNISYVTGRIELLESPSCSYSNGLVQNDGEKLIQNQIILYNEPTLPTVIDRQLLSVKNPNPERNLDDEKSTWIERAENNKRIFELDSEHLNLTTLNQPAREENIPSGERSCPNITCVSYEANQDNYKFDEAKRPKSYVDLRTSSKKNITPMGINANVESSCGMALKDLCNAEVVEVSLYSNESGTARSNSLNEEKEKRKNYLSARESIPSYIEVQPIMERESKAMASVLAISESSSINDTKDYCDTREEVDMTAIVKELHSLRERKAVEQIHNSTSAIMFKDRREKKILDIKDTREKSDEVFIRIQCEEDGELGDDTILNVNGEKSLIQWKTYLMLTKIQGR